jgi:FKBP-type peptidyl-prolyl cis-trans isomerase
MLNSIVLKRVLFISLIFFLAYSCNNPFPEYKSVGDETYMQLKSFGDSEKQYNENFYSSAEIIIHDGAKIIFHLYSQQYLLKNNPFKFLLTHLNQGDSAVFMIKKNKLIKEISPIEFSEIENEYLKIDIKVHQYFSEEEYEKEVAINDDEMLEQLLLQRYLAENNIKAEPQNGVYIVKQQKGKGIPIEKGKVIQINYKASFINYIQFDNTYNKQYFGFTYGTPDQVIEGLQIALNGMKKGEKAKIIIPSQLAFGEEGSSTGIVPPFATVIYELEIVNVK